MQKNAETLHLQHVISYINLRFTNLHEIIIIMTLMMMIILKNQLKIMT